MPGPAASWLPSGCRSCSWSSPSPPPRGWCAPVSVPGACRDPSPGSRARSSTRATACGCSASQAPPRTRRRRSWWRGRCSGRAATGCCSHSGCLTARAWRPPRCCSRSTSPRSCRSPPRTSASSRPRASRCSRCSASGPRTASPTGWCSRRSRSGLRSRSGCRRCCARACPSASCVRSPVRAKRRPTASSGSRVVAGRVGLTSARMRSDAIDLTVPPLAELQKRRSEKWSTFEPDVLSLTVAEMDFPVATEIRRAVTATVERSDLGYAIPASAPLRDALVGFAARRLHWAIDPEQITVVPDVMVGLLELCRAIAGAGGAVACAAPAYPPFLGELPSAGVRVLPVSLAAHGAIDLNDLDRAIDSGARALVLSSPHNPTGRVLPRAELEALAERCAAREVWVLADEIHAPLVLPGATHLPWLEVSPAARRWGISLTSASKAFNL